MFPIINLSQEGATGLGAKLFPPCSIFHITIIVVFQANCYQPIIHTPTPIDPCLFKVSRTCSGYYSHIFWSGQVGCPDLLSPKWVLRFATLCLLLATPSCSSCLDLLHPEGPAVSTLLFTQNPFQLSMSRPRMLLRCFLDSFPPSFQSACSNFSTI